MRTIAIRLAVIAMALGSIACAPTARAAEDGLAARLRMRVTTLCAPGLAGRAAGAPGAAAAAETLAAWFGAAGLEPAFDGRWLQPFPLTGQGWSGEELAGRGGANVAGVRRGQGALAGRWLVVGAHLDHLGETGPATGAAPPPGAYYPGANDNASGVAIVHELARTLAGDAGTGAQRSVLLVNFDAEEVGLQGAAWFVNHPPVALDSIDVMVNLDTVGRLGDGRLVVSGLGTAAPLGAAVEAASRLAGLGVNPSRGGWSGSDHMVFNTREVPVLFLFGGPYPEYNRPTDDAASLDYEAMARISRFTDALVGHLLSAPGPFAWEMVAGALREDDESGQGEAAGNRQTWLGTMPDFTEGQAGYRLASVFEGSPAATAGLQKGDLLVSFGDYPVSDLATFTRALRAYGPGDLVEIRIVRDGRELHFTVALGDRAQRR